MLLPCNFDTKYFRGLLLATHSAIDADFGWIRLGLAGFGLALVGFGLILLGFCVDLGRTFAFSRAFTRILAYV